MHKKTDSLSDPNDWEHVKFMENEGDRYLDEMDKDLEDIDSQL
jgi:hypothetical protein